MQPETWFRAHQITFDDPDAKQGPTDYLKFWATLPLSIENVTFLIFR